VSEEACDRGDLIVIAAPSGAGKTTLVHALRERMRDLIFSVSHTTRQARVSERDGVDYFFIDEIQFRQMIESGDFLEHAQVFDNWYGTSKAVVEALRTRGKTVILEIDWQGAQQVRSAAPDAKTIFIMPPSVAELERRLCSRGTDSETTIARRSKDSVSDMRRWEEFDYVIVNEDLTEAVQALADIVAGQGGAHRCEVPETRPRVERILAGHD